MVTDNQNQPQANDSELEKALLSCKSSFMSAGFFSLFINLLLLMPAIYMLQVYDRVLSSGSESTLLMLTLILVFLFLIMGGLEWTRSQILIVTSNRLDQLLSGRVFDAMFTQALSSGGRVASAQPLNDLLQLRQFMTGPGLFAFFDAPWMPIYVAVLFLFHPVFGVMAVIAAVILIFMAVWNEYATRGDLQDANGQSMAAQQLAQSNLRNAEAIEAMGMLPRMRERWQEKQLALLALQGRASGKSGMISSMSKTFRLTIQSLALGLGAYLAIHKEITPGLVIAGSILLGRALAPLDQLIVTWRGFLHARVSYQRLGQLLDEIPAKNIPMPLPAPLGEVSLEKVVIMPPGAVAPIIKGISLNIEAGTQLAIIGPSAAGKSTLARAILGLYQPVEGSVRLDGAEIDQWDREQLGHYIGYLPQDVELLDGSISENIARFSDIDADKVVAAAQAAGIHDMVLHLPEGYDSIIVGNGNILSAGQRQRLGLARALYGNPKIILLDEPNSNLDQVGDQALLDTLTNLKQQGSTVIVITHRSNVLSQVDKIMLLVNGEAALYGARDQVLASLQQSAAKSQATQSVAP
ncbi:MAG: type I secretion system permease/ATPase, partial [Methylococcales bacterium]|nr:type I secretion system permease/ATPase [Methylococcales bacterium]